MLVCHSVHCEGKWKHWKNWGNAPQGENKTVICRLFDLTLAYTKECGCNFIDTSMFMEMRDHFLHALMHPCIVRVWFLCGRKNNACVIVYLLCETSVEHPTSFVEPSETSEAQKSEQ